MSEITVADAALRLRVRETRVRQLVAAGTIAARRVGRQWVIDDAELDRHAALISTGSTSRAMSPRVAWGAAAILDHRPTPWLTSSERSRLTRRLRTADPQVPELFQRWLTRRQVRTTRLRAATEDIPAVLAGEGVVATGLSAVGPLGLGLIATGQGEAYVTAAAAQSVTDDFFLVPSGRGNLLLRIVDGSGHTDSATRLDDGLLAPTLMVAVDLLDQPDTRSRSVGRDLLRSTVGRLTATGAVQARS